MHARIPIAWLQLKHEPRRLVAALAGIAFAAVLILMQLGFHGALYESSVRFHSHLMADLVLISPQSPHFAALREFPRRRLYQALGFDGVAAVSAVYTGLSTWKDLATGKGRDVFVLAFDPGAPTVDLPDVLAQVDKLRVEDWCLFDRFSRPEYGPVAQLFEHSGALSREVGNRRLTIAGLFALGTSFGLDGTLITSDLNFLRLFPTRPRGAINIGLVTLRPGSDTVAVRQALVDALPEDVVVFTKAQFLEWEKRYWADSTPIGFVLGFGTVIGFVVGAVVVYQILFSDISNHLAEYATLKAMGYTHWNLTAAVMRQALILAALGFVPGFLVALGLYRISRDATQLPVVMTPPLAAVVFGLTVLMCCTGAMIAVRRLRSADPAEIF